MAPRHEQIQKLTTLIQQSPFRLLSDDEVSSGTQLTRGEFEARAHAFVNDAESGIPGDDDSIALAKAILAKMHRARLPIAVARAYMAPLYSAEGTPLPKKRPRSSYAARTPRPRSPKLK